MGDQWQQKPNPAEMGGQASWYTTISITLVIARRATLPGALESEHEQAREEMLRMRREVDGYRWMFERQRIKPVTPRA
jgi:hypothetical protein